MRPRDATNSAVDARDGPTCRFLGDRSRPGEQCSAVAQHVADPAPLVLAGEAEAREQLLLARDRLGAGDRPSAPRGARTGTRPRAARRPPATAASPPAPSAYSRRRRRASARRAARSTSPSALRYSDSGARSASAPRRGCACPSAAASSCASASLAIARHVTVPPDAQADPHAARSAAASGCCPASGACGCRCRGPACRTATPGRSPPATGSCSSTRACTSPARWRTSSARSTRSACGSSTSACSSAPTPTSTTAARRRAIAERAGLRGLDAPGHEHLTAAAEDPEATLARRLEVARQSGVPEEPLRRWAEQRRGRGIGLAGPLAPTATSSRASWSSTDLGDWHGDRDARPRALARLPAPARAAPADLRRPPARPHLAVLRLRLHARPGGRVPGLARHASTRSTRGSRWPATGGRSPTSTATSTATARWSPSASTPCARALADGAARPPTSSRRASTASARRRDGAPGC